MFVLRCGGATVESVFAVRAARTWSTTILFQFQKVEAVQRETSNCFVRHVTEAKARISLNLCRGEGRIFISVAFGLQC